MAHVVEYALGVVVFVLGVLVSIGLHEVGHMVPAKKFGVRVSQYMVGFGPTIWSKTKGETEYGLKWIPLGGYVRLVGMYPTDEAVGAKKPTTWWGRMAADARGASAEEIHPGEDHRAFYRLSVPKKLVVMFGGPVMNLLLAVVFTGIVMVGIGLPTQTTTVSNVSACVPTGTQDGCADDAPASPAKAAGLQPGDKVVSWGGREVGSWDELSAAIRSSANEKVQVVVERDGQRVPLPEVVVAQVSRADDGTVVASGSSDAVTTTGYAGIGVAERVQRQSVWDVPVTVGDMSRQVGSIVVRLPQQVWSVADRTAHGQDRGAESVLSIVGVGRVAGEIASADGEGVTPSLQIAGFLQLLAAINVSLFVFNLVPLPPLDGGHIAAALWEGLRRQLSRLRGKVRTKPADSARLVPVGYAVFALLVIMSVPLIWADIVNQVQ